MEVAKDVAKALDQVVPKFEPVRGGLSIIAGGFSGALIDTLGKGLYKRADGTGFAMCALFATGEAIVAVAVIDAASRAMAAENDYLFSLGLVHNLHMVNLFGQKLSSMLMGELSAASKSY